MAGTRAGGLKAAIRNKRRNPNFYADIGAKGGKKPTTGGFLTPCECGYTKEPHMKAHCAGAKGGHISRRRKKHA